MAIREVSLSLVLGALVLGAAACAPSGKWVWVHDLPANADFSGDYLVSTGDVISVRVINQDSMSTKARVRNDGRVALPLLGDVEVRGKKPASLRAELEARLKEFIVAPSVTVNVEEVAPVTVSVLGEVGHPGVVQMLDGSGGVAQALASAGGLTDYASRDRIFVVRGGDKPVRVRFTYNDVSGGDQASSRFQLRRGDVVVVE
jgi:polysaccharide export outer membrane protein